MAKRDLGTYPNSANAPRITRSHCGTTPSHNTKEGINEELWVQKECDYEHWIDRRKAYLAEGNSSIKEGDFAVFKLTKQGSFR
jgi:hypothetical protein